MSRRRPFRIVALATTAAVAIVLAGNLPAVSQEGTTAKPKAAQAGEKQTTKKKTRKFHGRLPAYYAKVVDDKQRKSIYAIQKEYKPKIDELKAQLAALTKERDEKILAELTPEQREKVAAARKTSQEKRRKTAKTEKQPAAATPSNK